MSVIISTAGNFVNGVATAAYQTLDSTKSINKLSWLSCGTIELVRTVQELSSKDSFLGKYFFETVGTGTFAEGPYNTLQTVAIVTNALNLFSSVKELLEPSKKIQQRAGNISHAPMSFAVSEVEDEVDNGEESEEEVEFDHLSEISLQGINSEYKDTGVIPTLRKMSCVAYNFFSLAGNLKNLNLVSLGRFVKPIAVITNITLFVTCALDVNRVLNDDTNRVLNDGTSSNTRRYLEVASNVGYAAWVVFSQALPYIVSTGMAALPASWILIPPTIMFIALLTDWISHRMTYVPRAILEAKADAYDKSAAARIA